MVVPDDDEKKEAKMTTQTEHALQTSSDARAPVPTEPIETIRFAATPCDDASLLSLVHWRLSSRRDDGQRRPLFVNTRWWSRWLPTKR